MLGCVSHFRVYITRRLWLVRSKKLWCVWFMYFCATTTQWDCTLTPKPRTQNRTPTIRRRRQKLNLPGFPSTLCASICLAAAGCQLSQKEPWDAGEHTFCISQSFVITVNQQPEEQNNFHQTCGVVAADNICMRWLGMWPSQLPARTT